MPTEYKEIIFDEERNMIAGRQWANDQTPLIPTKTEGRYFARVRIRPGNKGKTARRRQTEAPPTPEESEPA